MFKYILDEYDPRWSRLWPMNHIQPGPTTLLRAGWLAVSGIHGRYAVHPLRHGPPSFALLCSEMSWRVQKGARKEKEFH